MGTIRESPVIGVIGQGWVGGSYAVNFEKRGYRVVRYGLEPQYVGNRDAIAECDIVFIAVPTPTTPEGFNESPLRSALSCVGPGKTAVIKSTILPGMTEALQVDFPNIRVMHSPEFLTEATASYDADHPTRNIIGISTDTSEHRDAAAKAMSVLPEAPYLLVCQAREAELIKYVGNGWFTFKVIFINMMYDLARAKGADWTTIRTALAADPRIGGTHLDPIHKSGRGAGGHCFPKDIEALRLCYAEMMGADDPEGATLFDAAIKKNLRLLIDSDKDLDLLAGIYGSEIIQSKAKS